MSPSLERQITTVGGIGNLPIAPGTWASAVTCLPALFLPQPFVWWLYVLLTSSTIVLGLVMIPKVQPTMGHDPRQVVIDEVAGMSLVCLHPDVLQSPWWLLAAFLVFRVFDIVKPWPANVFNARTDGWAVIADDIVAAIYTVVVVILAVFSLQIVLIWLETH